MRVLLVEDDPSLQRFVAMALEDEDVRLQGCTSVDEALLSLATQAFDLVISDLMLPGRHGNELLATLSERPELRGQAMLAVFSAGLNGQVRQQLEGLGVSRFLVKPCSLADLRACVQDARTLRDTASPVAPAEDSARATASVHQTAVEEFFGGNAGLYQAFLARCRAQFPQDIARGRDAARLGQHQPLRHLAHSLKSVLQTLGYPDAAALARELEDLAQQAGERQDVDSTAAIQDRWLRLEAELSRLI
ncbi:response regulator [Roseateles sp. SL47]|uniref:Hpt domain-containing response regulator n=1 Tax=Roseateles sp. SL47 TaxID=2995138 RepID=UPI00226E4EB5|nr:response regulator [Roseateles sp. SL47]WAC73738.1 response regulator [Roseateles sp. SL47]